MKIERLWTFLKRNWDTLLTMIIAAPIAVLSYFQTFEPQVVSAAILSVLFLIACGLLVNRETNNRLQQTTEKVWERMQKPPIEDVLVPYKTWMDEIETSLGSAKEVWVLSRTCTRFWEDYQKQLQGVLDQKGTIRLMLVDPRNGALQMIANSAELARLHEVSGPFLKRIPENSNNRLNLLRAQVQDFVEYIAHVSTQVGKGRLALRIINYLPAHTLVIVNGQSEQGIIFVELGTFYSNGRSRPTFCLFKSRDRQLFDLYRDEFLAMWDCSQPMDDLLGKSNPG